MGWFTKLTDKIKTKASETVTESVKTEAKKVAKDSMPSIVTVGGLIFATAMIVKGVSPSATAEAGKTIITNYFISNEALKTIAKDFSNGGFYHG